MDLRWWLDLASFAGIAVLSVPVWSLNFRKKRLRRIRAADRAGGSAEAFRNSVRAILRERRSQDVAEWRRLDELCLALGYVLLLGSAGLRLILG